MRGPHDTSLLEYEARLDAEIQRHARCVGRIEAEIKRGMQGSSSASASLAESDFFVQAAMQLSCSTKTAHAGSKPPLHVLRKATLGKLKKGIGTSWTSKIVVCTPESIVWFDTAAALEEACAGSDTRISATAFLIDATAAEDEMSAVDSRSEGASAFLGSPFSAAPVGGAAEGATSLRRRGSAAPSSRVDAPSTVAASAHKSRVALASGGNSSSSSSSGGTATVVRLLCGGGGGEGSAAPSALHCIASTRFKDKPVFDLLVGGQRVGTFLCSDPEERDAWITDIAATRLELEQRSERIAVCEALKSAVAGAADLAHYLDALALLPACGVCVPLWWVRHAVQSGGVGTDSYDYRQIFKDLQRDTIEVRLLRVGGGAGGGPLRAPDPDDGGASHDATAVGGDVSVFYLPLHFVRIMLTI